MSDDDNDDLIDGDYDFEEGGSTGEYDDDDDDEQLLPTNKDDDDQHASTSSDKKKTRLRKEAQQYSKNLEKRGVIYMSRIPPGMKPNKARTLFEQFGEVTRLFLQEEDASHRKQRKLGGGNSSKQFKEGWIEFADKKVAKSVAESLNNTSIGGCKSHAYHDDIWNLKYLKKFKWDYLTEKFAYERRVRETKLRASMLQSKRANAEFVELVERGKQERFIDARKRKRQGDGDGGEGVEAGVGNSAMAKVKRQFRQVESIGRNSGDGNYVDAKLIKAVFTKKQ